VTRAAHPLDALAWGLGAVAVALVVTGGGTIAGWSFTRVEDVVATLAIVVGVRGLIDPYRLPHVRPERAVLAGVLVYASSCRSSW
jgi:hypothetical protein